jgi:hypothetical protein
MFLSKLSGQKQDHPPKFLRPSPRRPKPVHPKRGLQLGGSFLFLHDAVDHMRMGFEPAGQTEGSQNRWITIPSQKQLTAIGMSIVTGGVLSKTSFPRSLASCPLLGSYSASWVRSLGTWLQFCEAVQKSRSRRSPIDLLQVSKPRERNVGTVRRGKTHQGGHSTRILNTASASFLLAGAPKSRSFDKISY